MGQTSQLGYFVHLYDNGHSADRPVDTMRSWCVANNLQHLYDEHFQHRINWCASTETGEGGLDEWREAVSANNTGPIIHLAVTPWTVKHDGMPANIDIAVATRRVSGSGTQTISANILSGSALVQSDGSFNPDDELYGTSTTYASTSATWVIDEQSVFDPDTDRAAGRLIRASSRPFLVRDGTGQSVKQTGLAFVKLRIKVSYTGATGAVHALTGVLLREFV